MNDIDECDLLALWRIRAWKLRKAKEPKAAYIDEVWPFM